MDSQKKRFPADTTLDYPTFLNNRQLNGELYAYLQGLSDFSVENNAEYKYTTYILKSKMPTQAQLASIFGVTVKTIRTYLNKFIAEGYLQESVENKKIKYFLPEKEKSYFLIPLETLQFFNDTCTEQVIKTYIYLGQKWKYMQNCYNGRSYVFTLKELGEHVGLPVENNQRNYIAINNILTSLQNNGLIKFEEFFDGQSKKKKLIDFQLHYLKG